MQTIRIFVPDTGPSISLAMGDALDLLLLLSTDVRLILTDVVEYEATHRSEELDDAKKLKYFLAVHADRIDIKGTFLENLRWKIWRERRREGSRQLYPGMLVKFRSTVSSSTCERLIPVIQLWSSSKTQELGLIPSAAEIRLRIQAKKASIQFLSSIDRAAEKISAGTE